MADSWWFRASIPAHPMGGRQQPGLPAARAPLLAYSNQWVYLGPVSGETPRHGWEFRTRTASEYRMGDGL